MEKFKIDEKIRDFLKKIDIIQHAELEGKILLCQGDKIVARFQVNGESEDTWGERYASQAKVKYYEVEN